MLFDEDGDREESPYPEPDVEPDPDPEDDLPDPETDLPSVPETPDPESVDAEVPQELSFAFWYLVVVFNAAVLALGLGAMFAGFEGNWDLGGRLLAVGGILFAYGYYKYRTSPYRDGYGEVESDAGEGEDERAESASGNATERDSDDEPDPAGTPAPDDEPGRAPVGTVRDADGDRYVLLKRSKESSLVRDPATGRQEYRPNEALEDADDSTLSVAAESVPSPARRVLSAAHDDRSLGLLVEIVDRGPVGVRSLLSAYDLCESDLHGLLAEFRAAGLLEETTVAGERGYRATDLAVQGVAHLRRERE